MRLFPILALSLFSLAGCASLSEEECQITDWYKLGQGDALEGYPDGRLQDHIKACQRYDIAPDTKLYAEGRQIGLQQYCTAENGFQVGRKGYRYQNICPSGVEKAFVGGYERGARLHRIELDIASANQERDALQRDWDVDPVKKDESDAERRDRLLKLSRQIRRLEREIRRLERERERELIASDRYLLTVAPET